MKIQNLASRTSFPDCQQTTQSLARGFHQILNDVSGFKTDSLQTQPHPILNVRLAPNEQILPKNEEQT